ncbi:MAG: catalase/peroxidase HPI [Myxococcota bacterium]
MTKSLRHLLGLGAGAWALAACEVPSGAPEPPQAAAQAAPDRRDRIGGKAAAQPKPNDFWWPDRLNLQPLRKNASDADPNPDFNYAAAFAQVDFAQLEADLAEVMTTSQDWWPADFGNYGPLFIRLSWHSAGTYRTADGRGGAGGGQQRFEPLNSWPDNTNLDKARRLLWPIKKKYGRRVSWADLMVLAGTVAMKEMGMETVGFAGGREDDWEPELVYWGPEAEMLASNRFHGEADSLEDPTAASQMGLIYVNPEGPGGEPEAQAAAHRIRTTFGRMAMNDEETVALIAGGHTFGKAHGAQTRKDCVGVEPAGAEVEAQGMGWANGCGKGHGADAMTSGLEGAWTSSPTQWTHQYLTNLYNFEWVKTLSPSGAIQWRPKAPGAAGLTPDAHDPEKRHPPMMFTTDLALKVDPEYRKISKRFLEDPGAFERAFARAWFKLTHRDMGPKARYVGGETPSEVFDWQDPVPEVDAPLVNGRDVVRLKRRVLASGLSVSSLVRSAWASASTYRDSDMRGGANGARIRLAPQKSWVVNDEEELEAVLSTLEAIRVEFNDGSSRKISMADMIVLAGGAAVEQAAHQAGHPVQVPFAPGRTDATQAMTDVASFELLEPKADGFRNYFESSWLDSPSAALVDKADLLDLTVPEMTVLVGGLRAMDANADGLKHGVLTETPGRLNNAFFTNLLDMGTEWAPSGEERGVFRGRDRLSGESRWTATEVDLIFGSNAELRAVAEYYAFDGAEERFVQDFVKAWTKVMRLDRFDLE